MTSPPRALNFPRRLRDGNVAITGAPVPFYSSATATRPWRNFFGKHTGRPSADAPCKGFQPPTPFSIRIRAAYSSRHCLYAIVRSIIELFRCQSQILKTAACRYNALLPVACLLQLIESASRMELRLIDHTRKQEGLCCATFGLIDGKPASSRL